MKGSIIFPSILIIIIKIIECKLEMRWMEGGRVGGLVGKPSEHGKEVPSIESN